MPMIPKQPQVGELEKRLSAQKKTKSGYSGQPLHGGDSEVTIETFKPSIVGAWKFNTDGWSVYPGFIPPGDQIVIYDTRDCDTKDCIAKPLRVLRRLLLPQIWMEFIPLFSNARDLLIFLMQD